MTLKKYLIDQQISLKDAPITFTNEIRAIFKVNEEFHNHVIEALHLMGCVGNQYVRLEIRDIDHLEEFSLIPRDFSTKDKFMTITEAEDLEITLEE